MKNNALNKITFMLICLSTVSFCQADMTPREELNHQFVANSRQYSDIYEHLPVLRDLAKQCSSVTEIGVRSMVSTWGILEGLVESSAIQRTYTGIDLVAPPVHIFLFAERLAQQNGIFFNFITANDMDIDIEPCDFLFIDSLHTYCHLTYELEKFSDKVNNFIAMHDTSAPWGDKDDIEYYGNYSEYPPEYNRSKRGLWPAVVDFLERHPEWKLLERRLNCHGFTILERVGESSIRS
ncbi:MAG: hypothetical protein ACHQUC_04315 [Chlamydiales bacterium]